ncbi:hypothetical protein V1514DRAFT_331915 [Lipomyces japonicus]|uniref:uncharacterized protein n=1 Tax=Lipomyces japonicus TaxID=56871 RepID=UPI0034CED926
MQRSATLATRFGGKAIVRTALNSSNLHLHKTRLVACHSISSREFATALDTSTLLKKSQGSTYKTSSKRFWENANIDNTKEGQVIQLGKKPIRTSAGHPLVIPANQTVLANLLVQEWATLPSLQIKPHSLPLTSLAARAIDIEKAQDKDEVKEQIVNSLLPYFDTDTMLIFAPSHEYNGRLREDQEKIYRPIIEWVEQYFGDIKLSYSDGDHGLTGNAQPEEIKTKATEWAKNLDAWKLTAFERAVIGGKSFLGAIKLIEKEITATELADAVTLEIVHQMKRWGEVEDSHDVDWADLRRQLSSASVLLIRD